MSETQGLTWDDPRASADNVDVCLHRNRDHTCLRPIVITTTGHAGLHSDGIAAWEGESTPLRLTVAGAAYERGEGPCPSDSYDGSEPALEQRQS